MDERNTSIDILKFLCAILVVFLHAEWILHDVVLPITRCAVPCFFIISGYLLFEEKGISPQRMKRNVYKISKITILATILFFVWSQLASYINYNTFLIPTKEEMLNWLIFNDCPFGFHLWYLYAYLYVLIVVWMFNVLKIWKFLFYLAPILFLIDLSMGTYGRLLFNVDYPYFYFRNYLFVGIPYFSIGGAIKIYGQHKTFCTQRSLLLLCILFVISSFAESYLLISIGKVSTRSNYISSILLAVCLFLLAIKSKTEKSTTFILGQKDSLYIYLYHPIVMAILSIVAGMIGISAFYLWIEPIVIVLITILIVKYLRNKGLVLS